MQNDAVQRLGVLLQLFLERVRLRKRGGRKLLVQPEELLDVHALPECRREQLLHPLHARLGRKLAQELFQLRGALRVGRDLDVVQQEYLVEADLKVRNEVLAHEALHAPLHGLADRGIARRRGPHGVLVRPAAGGSAIVDIGALECRAEAPPETAAVHFGHGLISCIRSRSCAPPARCP
jgi:hypothetical protein